jgi:hypothetical protein
VRRNIAGALLAMAFASTGIGLAATSYADDGAPAPNLADAVHAGPTCLQDRALWLPGPPAPHPVRRTDIQRRQLEPGTHHLGSRSLFDADLHL